MDVLTIRAFLLLWSALRTWEEHLGGGTPIRHVDVKPGQRDGILDDGRNDGGWRRQILGGVSGPAVRRAPPDLTQRPGEERSDLVVGRGEGIRFAVVAVGRAAVVAEEGGVPEHVAAPSHVHGVAEVAQRGADHVHAEVTFKAAFAVGVCDQAFEARQLLLKIHVRRGRPNVSLNENCPRKRSLKRPLIPRSDLNVSPKTLSRQHPKKAP